MSDFTTNWVLKLKDLMSGPAKTAQKVVGGIVDSFKDMGEAGQLSGKKAVTALKEAKEYLKEVGRSIKDDEKKLNDLEKALLKIGTGSKQWQEQKREIDKVSHSIEYQNTLLVSAKKDVEELTEAAKKFKEQQQRIDLGVTQFNQLTDVVEKVSRALDFSEDFKRIEGGIQLMTGASGDALSKASRDVYKLAKVYKVNGEDISATANALAKSFGISFTEALDKVEEGFKKGANLSKNMLPVLSQYGPLMQEMGYDLDEVIAKMAKAGKSGLDINKAFAALSKGGVELKKMTETQLKALEGIGILPEDLKDKTIKEAMDIVGSALEAGGATMQEKQTLLSGLFKMQGEKMGNGLMTALFDSAQGLGDLPVVEEAGAQIKGFMADMQSWLADTMGGVAIGLQQLAPVFTGIGGAIILFQDLTKVTWLQNVATKALTVATGIMNVVSKAGPWGWVALAIGAVVLVVKLLANKFEWAAGVVEAASNSWKAWGKVIVDFVLFPIKQLWGVLEGIWKLLQGDWAGAWNAVKKPTADLVNDAKAAVGKTKEGYDKGVRSKKDQKALAEQQAKNDAAGVTGAQSVNDIQKVEFEAKSPDATGSGGKGGKAKGDGMSISGSGGGKAFTMNLNIVNNFTGKINSRQDIRELADEVMGVVVDRGRDFVLSI